MGCQKQGKGVTLKIRFKKGVRKRVVYLSIKGILSLIGFYFVAFKKKDDNSI